MSNPLAQAVTRAQQTHVIGLSYSMADPIMPVLTADSYTGDAVQLADMIAQHPKLFGCNAGAGLALNVRRMHTEFSPQDRTHSDYRHGAGEAHGLPSARGAAHEQAGLAKRFQAEMDALRTPQRFMEQSQRAQLILGDSYLPTLSIDMPPSEMLEQGQFICSSLQEFAESTNDETLRAAANETHAALKGIMASLETALSPVVTFGGNRRDAAALLFVSDAEQNARLVIQPGRSQRVRDIALTSRSTYTVDCPPMVWLQLQGAADAFLIHSASLNVETSETDADRDPIRKKDYLSTDMLRQPLNTTEGTGVREYDYYMHDLRHVHQIEFLASKAARAEAHITLPPFERAVLAVHMSGGMVYSGNSSIGEREPLVLLPKPDGKPHELIAHDPASIMLIGPLVR